MARRSPAKVIGSRLLQALPVMLLATFMVFSLLKLVPGDIAVTLAGENASDARITEIRKIYGLDRPFLVQYGSWLAHAMQGDLSQSLLSGEKVATSIARAFPNTLLIVAIALVLALATGHSRWASSLRSNPTAGSTRWSACWLPSASPFRASGWR